MKVALIPPYSGLHYSVGRQFHMMLPFCFKNTQYRKFFLDMKRTTSAYTIMDNGAFEGAILNDEELLEQATKYRVDEIVVPDVLGDRQATIDRAEQFLRVAEEWPYPFRFMLVVQGQGWEDCYKCMEDYARLAMQTGVPYIFGLPRHITEDGQPERRIFLSQMYLNHHPERLNLFHFLGYSRGIGWHQDGATELQALSRAHLTRYVRSVDTSAPWVWANEGKKIDEGEQVQRPPNYFDLPLMVPDHLIRHNISVLDRWVGSCEYQGTETSSSRV